MGKGFFFSADAGMFVVLTILAAVLALHGIGYTLDRVSGIARTESLRMIAESAVDTLLLSGDWHCTLYNEPVPGCITGSVSKDELGLQNCRINCSAITGCNKIPPADADVYVVDFNVCIGNSIENCVWESCRLEVWR